MSTPRLSDQLCFKLYTASRLVTRSYRPVLEDLDLTYPQYLVMLVLWEAHDLGDAPLAVKDLGDRLALDSGTLTPLLRRLQQTGYLTRERSQEDERRVLITLTPAGIALAERAEQVPQQLLCDWRGDLADLRDLQQRLARFLDSLVVSAGP